MLPKGLRILPSAYFDDNGNTIVIRSSAIGSCLHGLVAELLGHQKMPPPRYLRAIFKLGEESEARVAAYLRSLGAVIVNQQKEVTLELVGARVVGHVDGAIKARDEESRLRICAALGVEWDGEWALWEHKNQNADMFGKFASEGVAAFPRYEKQTLSYSLATRLPVLMTSELREKLPDDDGGVRHRSPQDDVGELTAHYFWPTGSKDDIQHRCNLVWDHYRAANIPDCDSEYLCDFREVGAASMPTNDALSALALRYFETHQELQLLDAQLRNGMGEDRTLRCGDYVVRLRRFGKTDKLTVTEG